MTKSKAANKPMRQLDFIDRYYLNIINAGRNPIEYSPMSFIACPLLTLPIFYMFLAREQYNKAHNKPLFHDRLVLSQK